MRDFDGNAGAEFERAVVVISLDAEQIWGYLDVLDEWRFCRRYPNVTGVYDRNDYLAEKRRALDGWAGLLTEVAAGTGRGSNVVPIARVS